MLAFGLRPLRGELIFGLLARYRELLGSDTRGTCKLLLGAVAPGVSTILPIHVQALSNRLMSGHLTADYLIQEHTCFPYFSPFLPEDRRINLIAAMRVGWKVGKGLRLTHTETNPWLQYCRRCLASQRRQSGQASWNRVLQLPGVLVCPEHKEALWSANVRNENPAGLSCPRHDESSHPTPQLLSRDDAVALAVATRDLVNRKGGVLAYKSIGKRMHDLLAEAGWVHTTGMFRAHLGRDFNDRFGVAALGSLSCSIDLAHRGSWINDLARETKVVHHPLRFLMLLVYLNATVADLLEPERVSGLKGGSRRIRSEIPELTEYYRTSILAELKGGATRDEVRSRSTNRFQYMKTYDGDWLDLHCPLPIQLPKGVKDNSEEDTQLVQKFEDVIANLRKASSSPPQRLTLMLISKAAGMPSFPPRRRRLPLCNALVGSACESLEQFWKRRLSWAADEMIRNGQNFVWKSFCQKAEYKPERYPNLVDVARTIFETAGESGTAGREIEEHFMEEPKQ